MGHEPDPITAPAPPEVPLPEAPLVRVIAQLRFPKNLAIEHRDAVAGFQRAVKDRYPILREEQTQGIVIDSAGAKAAKSQTVWRFSDLKGEWKLSLAPDFLAIDTILYRSRSDFLSCFRTAVEALDGHFSPTLVDRLGLRYIDRITGKAVDEITDMVKPPLLGLVGTAPGRHATHALTETMFEVNGSQLRARCALLPADVTHDPMGLEPISQPSWVLDLDMFRDHPVAFAVDEVLADTGNFAERIYTFFRWAVTDTFLKRYGGTP